MPFKIATLALLALSITAQTRESNPYPLTDAAALAQGKLLYSYYCVFCHGMDGVSGRGARLASTYRKHGSSDREIYRTIADGVPGTEMSGHWIEEDEIWKIVLFVRQFRSGRGGETVRSLWRRRAWRVAIQRQRRLPQLPQQDVAAGTGLGGNRSGTIDRTSARVDRRAE